MVSIGACLEKEKLRFDWSNLVEQVLFDVLRITRTEMGSKWGTSRSSHRAHGQTPRGNASVQRRYPSLSW